MGIDSSGFEEFWIWVRVSLKRLAEFERAINKDNRDLHPDIEGVVIEYSTRRWRCRPATRRPTL